LPHAIELSQVPGLFAPDERDAIIADVREWAAARGASTRDAVWAAFVDRCRDNLHIVLAMSPVGDAFRARWAFPRARGRLAVG
jgi:dynein heavy chain